MDGYEWLLNNETPLRLTFFLGIFFLMAGWELYRPCRPLSLSRWFRWGNNLGLVFLNSVLLKLLFPVAAVGVADYVAERDWGLFGLLPLPDMLEIFLAIVLLDLLIYAQHVLFHKVPQLWSLHKVHHADPDYDVTTGARFHPIEILLSMLIKMFAIFLLGPAAVAVLIFEILLNTSAMFNHSNIQLYRRVDRCLRWFIVTPDMHRVHHSTIRRETDSNYGFALSCWDRLFKTYTAQPSEGHKGMHIGLKGLNDPAQISRLDGMLMMPFRKRP